MQALTRPLYQIRQDHINLLTLIEENDGILNEDLEQGLSLTQDEFQDKALSYGYITKEFDNTTEAIEREIERLEVLRNKAKKRKELFKERLKEAMLEFGVEKITSPTLTISFRKSESVEIIDESKVPDDYIETKEVKTISKTKIKEDIKAGAVVPGAELKSNRNLQIK